MTERETEEQQHTPEPAPAPVRKGRPRLAVRKGSPINAPQGSGRTVLTQKMLELPARDYALAMGRRLGWERAYRVFCEALPEAWLKSLIFALLEDMLRNGLEPEPQREPVRKAGGGSGERAPGEAGPELSSAARGAGSLWNESRKPEPVRAGKRRGRPRKTAQAAANAAGEADEAQSLTEGGAVAQGGPEA